MKNKIFLSHNSEDKHIVKKLANELQNQGADIWIDELEILPGEKLIERIGNGINDSALLIAFISSRSIISNWVKKELSLALTKEINIGKLFVIPVLIDDAEIPFYIQDVKYADLRDQSNIKKVASDIIKATKSFPSNSRVNPVPGSRIILTDAQLSVEKAKTKGIATTIVVGILPTFLFFLLAYLIPVTRYELGFLLIALICISNTVFSTARRIQYKIAFRQDKNILLEFADLYHRLPFSVNWFHPEFYRFFIKNRRVGAFKKACYYEGASSLLTCSLILIIIYILLNWESISNVSEHMTPQMKEEAKRRIYPILKLLFE